MEKLNKDIITREDDHRVSIPLMMLDGNLDCLLNNHIEVETISIGRYGEAGVVLMVTMNEKQKEKAAAVGFKTGGFLNEE